MVKVALVTGGNRGLGQETASRLVALGWKVLITSRERQAGLDAAKRIGHGTWAIELDVRRPEGIAATVRARTGSLDALVNNAGLYGRGSDRRAVLETNLFGPMRLTEELLPLLADGARVVNVSSGLGELAVFSREKRALVSDPALDRAGVVRLAESYLANPKGWPDAYAVSKAMLNALTRIDARGHPRLRVNAVCPGWVRTRMGGRDAPRSVEEGAAGIVWAAAECDRTGGFFRDGRPIPW